MMNKSKLYVILSILSLAVSLMSCTDDDIQTPLVDNNGVPKEITEGYSLNLAVTLDAMGGSSEENPMKEFEDYVSPEKFRVLFFDEQDQFLFESKSRWVKKLPQEGDNSRWFVSIPVFSYGNDTEYNWNWEEIRKVLTTEKFRIAILANRPDLEWNMGIVSKLDNSNLTDGGWFDNTGPKWSLNETRWGDNTKKIFDLHHGQYDPIYQGKNFDDTDNKYYDVYDFIADTEKDEEGNEIRDKKNNTKAMMGATSSWVDWGNEDNASESKWGLSLRHWIHPDEKHPIPMYGIQEFDPLTDWKEGTTFDLTRDTDKPISLLRSVVKAELLIPEYIDPDLIDFIIVFYSNIYARCEPMDIWTPTDQIWKDHDQCEWKAIWNYGPITRQRDFDANYNKAQSKAAYQSRMSWFYGLWKEKAPEWEFGSLGKDNVVSNNDEYPRVFNTCIQRNTSVLCKDNIKKTYGGYHHWIVYMGERNVNDPTNILDMGRNGNGAPTIIYWMVSIDGISYSIPFIDYNNITTPDQMANAVKLGTYTKSTTKITSNMNEYEKMIQNIETGDNNLKPLPLLRNHHYKFVLSFDKSRDFSKLTEKTKSKLNADVTYDGNKGKYWEKTTSNYWTDKAKSSIINPIQAYDNSLPSDDNKNYVIPELLGITFENSGLSNKGNIILQNDRLRINTNGAKFNLPKLRNGDIITIMAKSASSSADNRGFKASYNYMTRTAGPANDILLGGSWITNTWVVNTTQDKVPIQFTVLGGSIDIQSITIKEANQVNLAPRRATKINGFTVTSEDLYSKSISFDNPLKEKVIKNKQVKTIK